ncbi:hypothetical protein TRIATDRAFT_84315 [Trichoderma atroviride IMI 206040]|uniref:Uncharacterized protein n=1 Tax=Hypocrea atroviridis (strain ATCC 20476 / IMI 206040) TaxID=452589 RepID=G9P470_HYPAI|nr:uncharacterized protein TRIATDRAFT_84315 [Trichoderma atroviride IMI 206040]EHK41914.1 hypothetical protein TRIATDRAFT_84315 [Trichoderma atroviride IMI 206040]
MASNLFPRLSAGTGSGRTGTHGSSSPSGFHELLGRLAAYLVRALPICSCKVWSASARFVPSRVSQRGKSTTTHPVARSGQTCAAAATECAYVCRERFATAASATSLTLQSQAGMDEQLLLWMYCHLLSSKWGGVCIGKTGYALMRAHIRSRVPSNDSNAETGAEEKGNQPRVHPSPFCGQSQGGAENSLAAGSPRAGDDDARKDTLGLVSVTLVIESVVALGREGTTFYRFFYQQNGTKKADVSLQG